jgi:CDP-diacylglycerol--glycerol-3-phosphate 3-phosphatidyltransferase
VKHQIPNIITAGRFFLAIGFFVVLGLWQPGDGGGAGADGGSWLIDVAVALFLVAVISDVIDGYIARSMSYVTNFGRVADPFVDKITVCGAMIFFIAPPFAGSPGVESGWAAWMVVLVIGREFLVTGLRGLSESVGQAFSATWAGKLKMFLQCVAIVWTLLWVGHWSAAGPGAWQTVGRDIAIWGTVLFTALSGLIYCRRAWNLFTMPPPPRQKPE